MGRFGEEGYHDIKAFETLYNELASKINKLESGAYNLPIGSEYYYDTEVPRFLKGTLNPDAPIVSISRKRMDLALDKLVVLESDINRLVVKFGIAA